MTNDSFCLHPSITEVSFKIDNFSTISFADKGAKSLVLSFFEFENCFEFFQSFPFFQGISYLGNETHFGISFFLLKKNWMNFRILEKSLLFQIVEFLSRDVINLVK